jgi:hypothetical protein
MQIKFSSTERETVRALLLSSNLMAANAVGLDASLLSKPTSVAEFSALVNPLVCSVSENEDGSVLVSISEEFVCDVAAWLHSYQSEVCAIIVALKPIATLVKAAHMRLSIGVSELSARIMR